jgi:hypothetical protein
MLVFVQRCELTPERLLRLYTSAPGAFWRHDIDVSLAAASKMARFAELAGVKATFYVMARGEFYNPFSLQGAKSIGAIIDAGQRIGIHVDYRPGPDVRTVVERDIALFVAAYPGVFDLQLVSFHRPPPEVLWREFPGFQNAYAPEWQGRYVSDARGEWDAAKEARVSDSMQIALHPEHWFPCA